MGCGRVAPKIELLRLAAVSDQPRAVLDPAGVLPGRGAYLCRAEDPGDRPSPACLALAVRRGGVARTLRRAVTLDLERPGRDAKLQVSR